MDYYTNASSGDIEKYDYVSGEVIIKGLIHEE